MLCYIDLLQQLQTYSSTRFETFRAVPELPFTRYEKPEYNFWHLFSFATVHRRSFNYYMGNLKQCCAITVYW